MLSDSLTDGAHYFSLSVDIRPPLLLDELTLLFSHDKYMSLLYLFLHHISLFVCVSYQLKAHHDLQSASGECQTQQRHVTVCV